MQLFNSRIRKALAAGVISIAAVGCATATPPKELVDAREAHSRASSGKAPQFAPAQLDTADKALALAERAFEDDPDDDETRDLAYIAHREALLAEAQASVQAAKRESHRLTQQMAENQAQRQRETQNELTMTKEQLAEAHRLRTLETERLERERQSTQATTKELESERQARVEAERLAAEARAEAKNATDELKKIAEVKEEQRGLVISLSGSVLFASAQAELLPSALSRLDQVAQALTKQENKMIVIEGHTDSRGSTGSNQELSLRRAQRVRDYLLTRGVPAERVQAIGIGEDRPIADNSTPEGRSNNRRVEIILQDLTS